MIPEKFRPYLNHPLVNDKNPADLELLDEAELNNVLRAGDLIFRGVREFSRDPSIVNRRLQSIGNRQLQPGNFGVSIQIARALTVLDLAHSMDNVNIILNEGYHRTKASTKDEKQSLYQYNKNMSESVIPRLLKNGLIEFNNDGSLVTDVIPYPVGSKLYVYKEFLKSKPRHYLEQINQFTILNNVQFFPELKTELEVNASNPLNFDRDYNALEDIDVIRSRQVRGREFTLSKSYLTGESSENVWETVLDTGDVGRQGLKHLMDKIGELGGYASMRELSAMSNLNPRITNRLIRSIDKLGLAQRVPNIDFDDGLSRATSGTKLNSNYKDLTNAQSILLLTRSYPEAVPILYKLQEYGTINEDELIDEFDPATVSKVIFILGKIGVIHPKSSDEDTYEIVPNKECDEFLSDVLSVSANTRRILGDEISIQSTLANFSKAYKDDEWMKKETKKIDEEFTSIIDHEKRK